ncbi:uncharacterized protein LOC143462986 [Clavelina lepadiformis]|uniref:uncharacterized protein LOC143462986 n=1 Tax=Clavelina lepadiformis TaxID=159417 RepID=UPI004041BAFB
MKTFHFATILVTLLLPLCSSLRCYQCGIINADSITSSCTEDKIEDCPNGQDYCFVSAAYSATTGYQGTTIIRGCRASPGQNICPIIPQGQSIAASCTQTCTTDECNITDGKGSANIHKSSILLFSAFSLLSLIIFCN